MLITGKPERPQEPFDGCLCAHLAAGRGRLARKAHGVGGGLDGVWMWNLMSTDWEAEGSHSSSLECCSFLKLFIEHKDIWLSAWWNESLPTTLIHCPFASSLCKNVQWWCCRTALYVAQSACNIKFFFSHISFWKWLLLVISHFLPGALSLPAVGKDYLEKGTLSISFNRVGYDMFDSSWRTLSGSEKEPVNFRC